MDAKEKAFRDAAKAEGYTDEQIDSHLASLAKPATEPAFPASNNYEDFVSKEMPQARTAVSRMKESASDTGSIVPYAIGAGGAAAAAAAAVGGKKLYDTLTNKMQDSAKTESPKAASTPLQEPTFDWQNFTPKDVMGDNTTATPAAQPEVAQKPTIADLQQKLGMNPAAPAAPVAPAAPNVPVAAAAPVEPVAPISVSAAKTPAEVVTNPVATPVEKAVTLTQEAPAAVPPPKAPRAERGSLATIANNPVPVEGMPGMRENYTKPKGINPVTGEPFIGPGGYNWLANQVGHDVAPQVWQEQYGQKNVPHAQVQSDYSATRYPPTAVTVEGQSGGAFGKPKYIPEYIKGNASIGGMATAGLNALGVAGLISDFKEAKKTGDWSNFGLNATGQVLANVIPKAALPAQLATFSKELGESPEELKALGKKLQDAQQASKIGAGRGMQGVSPPTR
jgi:hypothetical protein